MAKKQNNEIHKKHLIVCEGQDEFWFLAWYLNNDTLAEHKEFANDIQIFDFGGNEELSNSLKVLKLTNGFEFVESLLVMRDAERDASKAISEVKSALRKADLPVPDIPHKWVTDGKIKVGFLLFPTFDEDPSKGTLEDLCISILKEQGHELILKDIDIFLDNLNKKYQREFPHEFKTKLHTYFSITDRYVSLKVGEAASAGAFDWESDEMNKLKEFILEIFESN